MTKNDNHGMFLLEYYRFNLNKKSDNMNIYIFLLLFMMRPIFGEDDPIWKNELINERRILWDLQREQHQQSLNQARERELCKQIVLRFFNTIELRESIALRRERHLDTLHVQGITLENIVKKYPQYTRQEILHWHLKKQQQNPFKRFSVDQKSKIPEEPRNLYHAYWYNSMTNKKIEFHQSIGESWETRNIQKIKSDEMWAKKFFDRL